MHSYVFRDLLKLSTIAAHACTCWHKLCFQLYTRPSWPRDARCIGGKMICFTREPEILSIFSTSSIAGTSLLIHSTDWSVTIFSIFFSAQVSQQPRSKLDQNVNLKRKRHCKIWQFSWPKPVVSLFCLLARTKTNYLYTSPLDWSGCGRSREPFTPAVRVWCKPHSYKRFLLPFM